ncbi:magnesium chelatase subunit ChlI family protein [Cupriavidus pauculus]|uniref:magnesium chelatase subunit ChlI family protein n=1 Tax=Cupriavidus pauculus TaxID=82633 RepID=UPI00215537C8
MKLPAQGQHEILDGPPGEPSEAVRARAVAARDRQLARQGTPNSELAGRAIDTHCPLDNAAQALLRGAMDKLGWSARAYFRVLKVARTIADLEGAEVLTASHVAEAIQ